MAKTYLALGDSYTIGESELLSESFPYQTVQLLRTKGLKITAPEIIAKTGWTTGELLKSVSETNFLKSYDFVSLLIGVNNQYRGLSVKNYKLEFKILLNRSIAFAKNNPQHVFVLSIPDWGVTPFVEGRYRKKIAAEINEYNKACKMITERSGCTFIDIKNAQTEDNSSEMLAADGLHPSGKEYTKWSEKLAAFIFAAHSA